MGWDVIILNSKDTSTISKVDTFSLPSFGQRQLVIDKLNRLFPKIEWDDDFAYGHLDNEEYFGNINVGEDDEMSGHFWLGIYGGNDPLKYIMTICKEYDCIAFDTITSTYITLDNPTDNGWKHFQNFRSYVEKHVVTIDNNKSNDK